MGELEEVERGIEVDGLVEEGEGTWVVGFYGFLGEMVEVGS
jgi:hypothetical protein